MFQFLCLLTILVFFALMPIEFGTGDSIACETICRQCWGKVTCAGGDFEHFDGHLGDCTADNVAAIKACQCCRSLNKCAIGGCIGVPGEAPMQ